MKAKLNTVISYKNRECAFIVAQESANYCNKCMFNEECMKVSRREIPFEDSPMEICSILCERENTNFAFFIKTRDIEKYCNNKDEL